MKSDVFSFGLLILEVISGRRVFDVASPPDQQYLLHWVSLKHVWKLHFGIIIAHDKQRKKMWKKLCVLTEICLSRVLILNVNASIICIMQLYFYFSNFFVVS